MLTYNMDVTPESVWKRTTPSEAELAQPYYCTEAGVFYARQHFSTARTDKESYLLFYTLRGAGLIEQGESHVVLSTGQALLLNCRTPQSYCTAPGQSCWHHYWVHLDGAGIAAMEPLLLPGKKLTPVQLTGVKMQEYFETLLAQMERSTVDSMVTTGLALHEMLALCARGILAQAEATSARQVILQAAETLRKNYQQELCLADLLAEAHMSKSYFLRHGHIQCILDPGAVNVDHSPIPEQQFHAPGIHVEFAGSFIVLYVCVLSALRHSHSGLSCFFVIRSRTFFDGSNGFILFSEESKSPAELVVVVRSSYSIQKHSPTLAKEKPKRGCIQ